MGKLNYTIKDNYVLFWNGHFSNWYPASFTLNGNKFNCAEQYMMYMKAKTFNDQASADKIMAAINPGEQKRLGKAVANFVESEWDKVKEQIVYDACLAKYEQNKDIHNLLLETGNLILVEASPYDTIWGIGLSEDDSRATDESQWKGLNLLGIALMKVRDTLKANQA
jgi:ribA/ribD-fused uncharacterized protein